MTQPLTESDPPCPRPDIYNCSKEQICGSILQIKNGKVEYRELCLHSHICTNTSAIKLCPKSSCYVYCCHGDLCNQYDNATMLANTPHDIQNFIHSTTVVTLKTGTTPTQRQKPHNGGVPSITVVRQITLLVMFINMLYMQ